jgi:hypothetical protein
MPDYCTLIAILNNLARILKQGGYGEISVKLYPQKGGEISRIALPVQVVTGMALVSG